jgi:membrane protease YdiL (CAAX protease family)
MDNINPAAELELPPYREPYTFPRYSVGRRIWRLIYPLLVFLGIQLAAASVVASVAGIIIAVQYFSQNGFRSFDYSAIVELVSGYTGVILTATMIFTQVATAAVFIPMWRKTRRYFPRITPGDTALGAGMSALIVLGLGAAVGMLIALSRIAESDTAYEAVERQIAAMPFVLRFVSVVLLAPVVEELCFRGILVNRASYWLPKWAVVVISAAAFGIAHLNFVQGINAAFLGAALALLYLRYRSIWVPIAAHAANNLISVVLGELGISGAAEIALSVVLVILAAGAVYVAVKSKAAVPEQESPALTEIAEPVSPAPPVPEVFVPASAEPSDGEAEL